MRRATLATLLLVRATVAEAFLPRASTFGRVVAVRGSAEDDDALRGILSGMHTGASDRYAALVAAHGADVVNAL